MISAHCPATSATLRPGSGLPGAASAGAVWSGSGSSGASADSPESAAGSSGAAASDAAVTGGGSGAGGVVGCAWVAGLPFAAACSSRSRRGLRFSAEVAALVREPVHDAQGVGGPALVEGVRRLEEGLGADAAEQLADHDRRDLALRERR